MALAAEERDRRITQPKYHAHAETPLATGRLGGTQQENKSKRGEGRERRKNNTNTTREVAVERGATQHTAQPRAHVTATAQRVLIYIYVFTAHYAPASASGPLNS